MQMERMQAFARTIDLTSRRLPSTMNIRSASLGLAKLHALVDPARLNFNLTCNKT